MQIRIFSVLAAVVFAGTSLAAAPEFTRIPVPDHVYAGGWEHFVGGGVSAFDCNGDLLPDLVAAGGENPVTLFVNATAGAGAALAFRTNTPDALNLTGVIGLYPLDIDSDGILDLAVLRVGENLLLKGRGNCDFTPFPTGFGFRSAERWSTAFSATWEAGATLPTLAFGNYVDRSDPEGPFGTCDQNLLYRPDGSRYTEALPLTPGFCSLSMLFSDWGRNGRADLRVSNDRHYYVRGGQEQLWAMEDTPRLYTEADGWRTYALWGMGIAARDVTGDGISEVYLTSMGDQRFQSLDTSADAPIYRDATYERGTTAHRPYTGGDGRPSTGWHVAFGDVQNDGRDDIFVAKGNVEQMPGSAMEDPNNLLLQQPDGSFLEAGAQAGIATMERSRGAVLMDLNLDGLLDLAVINRRAPMEVYQNTTLKSGNWLLLELTQNAPNRNAIGAFVEVMAGGQRWTQELTVGGGHASGASGLLHFGLGSAASVKLRTIWPDGAVSDWQEVAVNQILSVNRDAGIATVK